MKKKVEGIIVRSRAHWYEYGEKNSKYFFNLEKRNHIKKHIRKLRMCGVITTDPFKILEAEKTFYENFTNPSVTAVHKTNHISSMKIYQYRLSPMN